MQDITIDSDGTVVGCCNDFSREVPLGKLSKQSIIDLLEDPQRKEMEEKLRGGLHDELVTCANCRADVEVTRHQSGKTDQVFA